MSALNITLVKYYARLVEKGTMKIEDIPTTVQEYVKRYMSGENITKTEMNDTTRAIVQELSNEPMGAITIPDLYLHLGRGYKAKRKSDGSILILIRFDLGYIFSPRFIGDVPRPVNTACMITTLDNCGGIFADPTNMDIHRVQNNDDMYVIELTCPEMHTDTGKPIDLFRINVTIKSDNYEDMNMTIFLRR